MPFSQVRDLACRIVVQEATPLEQNGYCGSLYKSQSRPPNRVKRKLESAASLNSANSNDPAMIQKYNATAQSML